MNLFQLKGDTEKCDVDTENRGQTCLLVQYPHCLPAHLNANALKYNCR